MTRIEPVGNIVMVIEAATDEFTTLVAVTIVVVGDITVAGAVYSPVLVNVPTDGLMDQVTPPMFTNAVNC